MSVNSVAIVGAGAMGKGIAEAAACADRLVRMKDGILFPAAN